MLFKRLICLCLICVMTFGSFSLAEEAQPATYVMAGYDSSEYRDWKTNTFFLRMEAHSGILFTYQQYNKADKWQAAKKAMLNGKDLPDILFKAGLTALESMEMLEKGVLIDLKPYLEENCPNLWAILQENPEYMEAITLPDGRIAALPYISTTPIQNYIWINKAWLEQLHIKMPTTKEELVSVLEAFKTKDPNQNGRLDEIPMGFLGPFDLKFLAHAFGMIANDYNIYEEEGKVHFMPLHENFREFITWCRDLYVRGILDHEGFFTSNSFRQVTDSDAVPTYGTIITPVAADLFPVSWGTDYVILDPLVYEGKQIYRDLTGDVIRGTFAVTSACKEPEKMLQWVDYLYSEEGAILAGIGKVGEDILVAEDGTWGLTETAKNTTLFSSANLITGSPYPGILPDDFQRKFADNSLLRETVEMQDRVKAVARRPFPYYTLTQAQVDEITPLQNEIGYYVDMQIARWVLGEIEISDETFAEFEKTLEEKGISVFLAFWQDILDKR